ncbi:MAG TPA: tRNA lysidine(34) synthetase TilS [Bacteroidota bacterium]|nr:tRNA lysidine(34) synthetase TilS [Bacteroidota bacterium]
MRKSEQSSSLYSSFKRFVQSAGLLRRGIRVLAGVSGGVDSVVMLDLLSQLSREWEFDLAVLHVNHQLRGIESDGDERFVTRLSGRYGLNVFVGRVATREEAARKKISIQEAARNLRYAYFEAKRIELRGDLVATAHNADDNAETMLLNLFRGTGIDGIAGIPIRRPEARIVRPLLFASREEIEAYARSRKLKHREDSSNRTEKYSRNFIRRRIMPLVEERLNPSAVRTLSQTSRTLRAAADFLDGVVAEAFLKCVSLDADGALLAKEELRRQEPFIRQMVVHRTLTNLGVEPSADRIETVVSLLEAEKGHRVDCGGGWTGENGAEKITIIHGAGASPFSYSLEREGTVRGGFFSLSVRKCRTIPNKLGVDTSKEYVDARKVRFPLRIRSWRKGDIFVPLGMKHRKKVSDLFVDMKISRSAKDRIPIVESGGEIVWVAGCRISERFKITSSSSGAYELSISGL